MDIAAAEAPMAPWIAVGVLVALAGLLLAALAGALVAGRRAARRAEPVDEGRNPVDDLPGFLESPPGSAAATRTTQGHLVTLTAPPPAAAGATRARRAVAPPPGRAVVATVAGVAVLLLAAAALVAATAGNAPADREGRVRPAERGDSAEARVRFGGLVLQQRAVGVTVTYPQVELTWDGDEAVARLTLPTWNCLAAEAPDDPEESGCVPGRTEYAELRSPALEVTHADDELRFGGLFETSTRPTGGEPEGTGRSYEIRVSLTADGNVRSGGWAPADGSLRLEESRARAVEGELRVEA